MRSGHSRTRTVLFTAGLGLGAAALVGLGVPAIAAATTSDDAPSTAAAQAVTDRLTKIKEALSGLVSDGTITQEQADKVAKTLDDKLPQRGQDGMGPGGMGPGGMGPGGMGPGGMGPGGMGMGRGLAGGLMGDIESLASTLKMTTDELHSAIHDGKTLAEIAKEQGVSTDTVVAAIVKAATARIDEAVKAGRLTADQAKQLKAGLEEKVTTFVNEGGPMRGGRHGWNRGDGDGQTSPAPQPSTSASSSSFGA